MKEKEKAICPQCGTEFTKGRYWQKYCTVECTKQYHNEKTKKGRELFAEFEEIQKEDKK
jgi:hypothetical protein